MRNDLLTYLEELKARGLSPEREARLRAELATAEDGHALPPHDVPPDGELARIRPQHLCRWRPAGAAAGGEPLSTAPPRLAKSLDELLERDRQREEDGFPRKIQVGKLVKPGRGAQGKGGGCADHGGGKILSRSDDPPAGRRGRVGRHR